MEGFDTKTLVHVGTELLVIGGLTFWFQRKTSMQQEEIENLREKIARLEEVIERHDQIFQSILGGRPPQFPPQKQSQSPPHYPSPQPQYHQQNPIPQRQTSQVSTPNHPQQTPNPQNLHSSSQENHNINQQSSFDLHSESSEEDENQDGDNIDELLKEELQSIGDPEYIEISCSGETCDLKTSKKKNRPSKLKKRAKTRKLKDQNG